LLGLVVVSWLQNRQRAVYGNEMYIIVVSRLIRRLPRGGIDRKQNANNQVRRQDGSVPLHSLNFQAVPLTLPFACIVAWRLKPQRLALNQPLPAEAGVGLPGIALASAVQRRRLPFAQYNTGVCAGQRRQRAHFNFGAQLTQEGFAVVAVISIARPDPGLKAPGING